ncbi:hypothetical protein [Haloarcula nitratireducens]|uniref:Uncharacterized protein n=1 Tax=Haloarcula nitratireducens TaxID=2487749 RepID=A0AAW4PFC8_9EURY|nr:hypothetical protein [Halomicroarcula nitratireducens]MBX0296670.1 hypothetical protein [Halomicroarcula nitratireducens]
MATTQANPQERIARNRLTQDPSFIGVDGENAAHHWDSYESAIVVVDEDLNAEKFELDETPCQTLQDWCEHTRQQRGWDIGPRVGGSLVGDLVGGVEA